MMFNACWRNFAALKSVRFIFLAMISFVVLLTLYFNNEMVMKSTFHHRFYSKLVDLFQIVNIRIINLNRDLTTISKNDYDQIKCVKTNRLLITTICLHDSEKDRFISGSLRNGGVWEEHILSKFVQIIRENPDYLVFDIGAQIGQYCLYAAKLGNKVVCVEPFVENIHRIHKAISKESLQANVLLIQNAISNRRNEIKELSPNLNNNGGQSLVPLKDKQIGHNEFDLKANKYLVETILLDDLLPYLSMLNYKKEHTKAIMKVDIEGFEIYAFQSAKKLFQVLDVQLVIMEWESLRTSASRDLILNLIYFFVERNYAPIGISGYYLKLDHWQEWPIDIIWTKSKK